MKIELSYVKERATKHSQRYASNSKDYLMKIIYVNIADLKNAFGEVPQTLKVTLEVE